MSAVFEAINTLRDANLRVGEIKLGNDPLPSPVTFVRHWKRDVLSANPRRDVPCGSCNACCRAGSEVELTPEEALRIPHTLNDRGVPTIMPLPNGHCPHLKDSGCDIYAERPRVCRIYDCRIYAYPGAVPDGVSGEPIRTKWAAPPTKTIEDEQAIVAMKLGYLHYLNAGLIIDDVGTKTFDTFAITMVAVFKYEDFLDQVKQMWPHVMAFQRYVDQNPAIFDKMLSALEKEPNV